MFSKDPELYVKQLFDIGKGQHVPITGLGMEYKGVECFFFTMWQNYLHKFIRNWQVGSQGQQWARSFKLEQIVDWNNVSSIVVGTFWFQ